MEHIANHRLGERLRKLRVERKLTLSGVEALTEGFGERINKSYLFRVERGITVPSIQRLRILAKVFRVKLSSLLEVLDNSFEEHEKRAYLGTDLTKLSYDQLRKEGIQAEREGDFTKATLYYRAAITSAENDANPSQRSIMTAKARYDLSVALKQAGNLGMALEEAQIALEEKDLPESLLDYIRLNLVYLYRRMGRPVMASHILDRLFQRSDDLERIVLVGAHTARGFLLLGDDPRAAVVSFRSALAVRCQKDPHEECALLQDVALAETKIGNYSRALRTLVRSRDLAKRKDLFFLLAKCFVEIGRVHYLQRNIDSAREAFREANALSRRHDYYEQLFLAQYYLRKLSLDQGDPTSAKSIEASLRYLATRIEESFEELETFRAELEGRKEEAEQ